MGRQHFQNGFESIRSIFLVTKGEYEGELTCFERASELYIGTWIGIALKVVKCFSLH